MESLAERSKRPHHHPNEHTEEEIAMIRRYRRRISELEITELWHRLKQKGYTRRLESLYRVMKKLGMLPNKLEKPKHISKPYEQMKWQLAFSNFVQIKRNPVKPLFDGSLQ